MIKLKRPKNDNPFLQKKDKKFMKDSYNQDSAEYVLRKRVEWMKDKGISLSKESFIKYAARHGFLKTEKDKQIVDSVIKKEKLKTNIYHKKGVDKDLEEKKRILMEKGTKKDITEFEEAFKHKKLKILNPKINKHEKWEKPKFLKLFEKSIWLTNQQE